MAQNLLFPATLAPECKRYFAAQRVLLSLQQGLYENAERVCMLLYPFINRTRGDAGRRAKTCLSHIPVRLQERSPGFQCNEPQSRTKHCPAHFSCRLPRPYFVLQLRAGLPGAGGCSFGKRQGRARGARVSQAPARPRCLGFPPAGACCRAQMPQKPGWATAGAESQPSPPLQGEKQPRRSKARAQGRAAPVTMPWDALSARRAFFV